MRETIFFCCLIFYLNACIGQDHLSHFIKGFKQDESVLFQGQKVDYMNRVSYNLPFIEKLEFRTETNDFDLQKQEYLIRVSPNSLKSIKTQKQYQETVKYMTKMELEAVQSQALRRRYDLIVDYIFQKKILAIKQKQRLLLKDKVTLLKRSIALEDFNIMELIEAEDDAQENNREIMDLKNAINTTDNTIQKLSHSIQQIDLDSQQMLTISALQNILLKRKPNKTANHPALMVQSSKAYNKILEYEWEAAKSKFSLAYFQTKYTYNPTPDDGFRKSISLGFGFDIPFRNSGRLDLNELQINILEAEKQYQNLKFNLNEQKYSLFKRLNNLIQKYELVRQQLEEGQAEFVLHEYQKIAEALLKQL